MDVESWRVFTKPEMREYLEEMRKRTGNSDGGPHYKSVLAIRQQLSPVDMYCYLKARFGEPNGLQNILRSDSSDNWIHWEYSLKADGEDLSIGGTYREVHFMLTEKLADADGPVLLKKVKTDFGHVGREKSEVLRSLEKWVIFPNKFVAASNVCAELHAEIVKASKALQPGGFPRHTSNAIDQHDLPYKCQDFRKRIVRDSDTYKEFKRVMDKRNHAIHGNIDPEREQVEVVYFEERRPLFKKQGDHIAKRLDAQIRQYEPEAMIQDYEDTHLFLVSVADCLGIKLRKDFRHLMEDPYPGYDPARNIAGGVLPDTTAIAHIEGVRYDDELGMSWK